MGRLNADSTRRSAECRDGAKRRCAKRLRVLTPLQWAEGDVGRPNKIAMMLGWCCITLRELNRKPCGDNSPFSSALHTEKRHSPPILVNKKPTSLRSNPFALPTAGLKSPRFMLAKC